MQRLSKDIINFARRHNFRRGVEAAAVISAARKILPTSVPAKLIQEVKVESFANGTLVLSAPSGVLLGSLSFYRPTIQKALFEYFGKTVVRRVITRASAEAP